MPYRDERRALETRENLLAEELVSVRTRLMALPTRLVAHGQLRSSRPSWSVYLLGLCAVALMAAPAVACAGLLGARALSRAQVQESQPVRPRATAPDRILAESEQPNRPPQRRSHQDLTW